MNEEKNGIKLIYTGAWFLKPRILIKHVKVIIIIKKKYNNKLHSLKVFYKLHF